MLSSNFIVSTQSLTKQRYNNITLYSDDVTYLSNVIQPFHALLAEFKK